MVKIKDIIENNKPSVKPSPVFIQEGRTDANLERARRTMQFFTKSNINMGQYPNMSELAFR